MFWLFSHRLTEPILFQVRDGTSLQRAPLEALVVSSQEEREGQRGHEHATFLLTNISFWLCAPIATARDGQTGVHNTFVGKAHWDGSLTSSRIGQHPWPAGRW